MLRSSRNLMEIVIQAEDGEIGRCKDFLVDEMSWIIRYMVADTSKWLPGRKVLIPPDVLKTPDWDLKHIPVQMTRAQIEQSPVLDEDAPVSRRYEKRYYGHFGWPPYWVGSAALGEVPNPYPISEMQSHVEDKNTDPKKPHFPSLKQLRDFPVKAEGEDVGHLHDCMMDLPDWIVRYLVVDISKWYQLKARKILLIPEAVTNIDLIDREIRTNIMREDMKNCPEYNEETPLDRDFEVVLHDYYGWPKYWETFKENVRFKS
ncbi:MAG: PRC-barrel domain-containing protein [Deltaproteobacteria bacterium]